MKGEGDETLREVAKREGQRIATIFREMGEDASVDHMATAYLLGLAHGLSWAFLGGTSALARYGGTELLRTLKMDYLRTMAEVEEHQDITSRALMLLDYENAGLPFTNVEAAILTPN